MEWMFDVHNAGMHVNFGETVDQTSARGKNALMKTAKLQAVTILMKKLVSGLNSS